MQSYPEAVNEFYSYQTAIHAAASSGHKLKLKLVCEDY
jgi:hypothetical protein